MKMFRLVFIVAVVCFVSTRVSAQTSDDRDLVYAAIEDYVDGLYQVQPDRIKKSVHPDLTKRGFWKEKDKTGYLDEGVMTFDALVTLASTFNAKGKLPKDAVKKIDIYDVQDQTATGKLTAYWGTDYVQLAKFDGRWMIVNILWQGPLPVAKP